MLPVVAIVGRPNTGKSTLFNRLIGKRYAIESNIPGTTRDRIYQRLTLRDFTIMLVDTGGLSFETKSEIEGNVHMQTKIAISEADVVLFVTDARQELTADDFEAANMLRKAKKPTVLIANKCDHVKIEEKSFNLYELGFGEPLPISAIQGIGVEHVEANIAKELARQKFQCGKPLAPSKSIKIAFVGRPNVGKSSLVNAIVDENRTLVSDTPGTTRDATNIEVEYNGSAFTLIDTAGVRRTGKVGKGLEYFSVLRSLQSVEECDTAVLILDYESGVARQDLRVAHYILESFKGLILVVNKCDLMEKRDEEENQLISSLKKKFVFIPWTPVIFASALTKQNIFKIFDLAVEIYAERKKMIDPKDFRILVKKLQYENVPMGPSRKKLKIHSALQKGVNPPHFVFSVNDKDSIHFSFRRYVERRIRETYGFTGTGIRLEFVNKK
ncbi:ribosome biogenesis GTPase Der [Candidatus Peregrinibacteria bacterium]|nr:ribosome biogenesis GTPase Der [Candidatus Peregrinibacteria bacterium]